MDAGDKREVDDAATGTGNAKKRKSEIPLYFQYLTNEEGRKCLLQQDSERPNVVTHITAVPLAEVNPNNKAHFINLDECSLDQLRKFAGLFYKGRIPNKPKARNRLNSAKNCEKEAKKLDIMGGKAVAKKGAISGVHFFRLIGLLLSKVFRDIYANINNVKTRADMETGQGRKDENFYNTLAEDLNDDQCCTHRAVIPSDISDELHNEYDVHINDAILKEEGQHPSQSLQLGKAVNSKDVETYLMQLKSIHNEIKRLMTTVTGQHENDPMKFVDVAIRNKKFLNKITTKAAYYFHMQCRFNQMIDLAITTSLPDDVKSSSAAMIGSRYKRNTNNNINNDKMDLHDEMLMKHLNTMETNHQNSMMLKNHETHLRDLRRDVAQAEKQQFKLLELKLKYPNSKADIELDSEKISQDIVAKQFEIERIREVMNSLCSVKTSICDPTVSTSTSTSITTSVNAINILDASTTSDSFDDNLLFTKPEGPSDDIVGATITTNQVFHDDDSDDDDEPTIVGTSNASVQI